MNASSFRPARALLTTVLIAAAAPAAPAPEGFTTPAPAGPATQGSGLSAAGPRDTSSDQVRQRRPGGQTYVRESGVPREFHFTRGVYSGGGLGFRSRSWATDFPKADRQFLIVIDRMLELLDVSPMENPMRLDDPELRRFPFLYALEVGHMSLTESEVQGLRDYLLAGGFLVIDDFWGTWEWRNFEEEMRRVFPGRRIEEIPPDHPIFHSFYDIEEILQVPNVGNARWGGQTHERDGYTPYVRGIFDDRGRLMVVVNWNTDLGDAWEWSEQPFYPYEYSNFAYKMAANFIVYAMTH